MSLIVEMLTKMRHARRSGQARFQLSTSSIFYDPAKVAEMLLKKADLQPVGPVTGDAKHAQFVLSISRFSGDKDIETQVQDLLSTAKLTLSDAERESLYFTYSDAVSQTQEKRFVITAYGDKCEVLVGKVVFIDTKNPLRWWLLKIDLDDGRTVWAKLSDEHRDTHQTPPLWSMLSQEDNSVFRVPRLGDQIEVTELLEEEEWQGLPRACCWRLPFASA
jgi:hypothetical protein